MNCVNCQHFFGNIFKKILLNWLLKLDSDKQFICILENEISLPDEDFADAFAKEIIESSKKKDALISRVKVKYSTQKNFDDLKIDIYFQIQNHNFS